MKRISPLKDKEKLRAALDGASSQVDALRRIGLQPSGGNFAALKKAVKEFGFELPQRDISSFKSKRRSVSNEEVFRENSLFLTRNLIKKRMFEIGFKNKCSVCGQGPEWNGKPLTLQLDHINGVYNDNRLENLRIICGHCHSQTDTFAGRNTKREKAVYFCKDCNGPATRGSIRCWPCNTKRERYTNRYPSLNILSAMVEQDGYSESARKLNVSDNAIRKHLKRNGVFISSPFSYAKMKEINSPG